MPNHCCMIETAPPPFELPNAFWYPAIILLNAALPCSISFNSSNFLSFTTDRRPSALNFMKNSFPPSISQISSNFFNLDATVILLTWHCDAPSLDASRSLRKSSRLRLMVKWRSFVSVLRLSSARSSFSFFDASSLCWKLYCHDNERDRQQRIRMILRKRYVSNSVQGSTVTNRALTYILRDLAIRTLEFLSLRLGALHLLKVFMELSLHWNNLLFLHFP